MNNLDYVISGFIITILFSCFFADILKKNKNIFFVIAVTYLILKIVQMNVEKNKRNIRYEV